MRPPGPVPVRFAKLMPRSSAIFRARGDDFTRAPFEAAAGRVCFGAPGGSFRPVAALAAAPRAGASDFASSAFGATLTLASAAAMSSSMFAGISSPSSSTTAMGPPSVTLPPGLVMNRASVPSWKHCISIVALSVSTSAMAWPTLTASPSLTNHLARVPSVMVSLSLGMSMKRGITRMGARV